MSPYNTLLAGVREHLGHGSVLELVRSPASYLPLIATFLGLYATAISIYRLYFHPLAKFPGPRIAAISNVWYACAWFSGRFPHWVQNAFEQHGDVVRIAPNELVFLTPEAAKDIYSSARQNREIFTKTNFQDFGLKEPGITAERDPEKHRALAKMLAPGLSAKAVREQEAVVHQHVDLLVKQMEEEMRVEGHLEMRTWIDWHTWDLSGDLAYNADFSQVRTKKDEVFFHQFMRVGLWATMQQVTRRFPWVRPLMWMCIPPSVILTFPKGIRVQRANIRRRLAERDRLRHEDYMGLFLGPSSTSGGDKDKGQPGGAQPPSEEWLLAQANVMIVANFDPMTNAATAALYCLLKTPRALARLRAELTDTFTRYDGIVHDRLQALRYLHAVLYETLRIHTNAAFGLPRHSPGTTVDRWFVPKGVTVQTCSFALTHSPRWFADPGGFHPERFLPHDHAHFDSQFAHDAVQAFAPFSQGPRGCPGSNPALQRLRILLAKLVWAFDMELENAGEIDWERDVYLYGIWERPDLWVRATRRDAGEGGDLS